ncbi:hypothetical protein BOTBODRAFT_28758 [Botryobasidium botryosum FD-172 SS1]|uniref:Uncharacterized protein n=1 Tax=Botryobasidium botryosum (strain FD-172 SS1) TaxID=930990 RepID=A0A067MRK4_BOTB1|nr:hypothetical protein BOTBODRAFT_28758 [Botryobasidium botryosum FD-172 SS1]
MATSNLTWRVPTGTYPIAVPNPAHRDLPPVISVGSPSARHDPRSFEGLARTWFLEW